MASDSEEILAALDALHAAQHAHDVDAMLEAYDTDGYVDASRMRSYFQGLVDQDALRSRSVDLSCAEIYRFDNHALVRPVVYTGPKGPRSFSFHLDKGSDGRWRIIDNNRSVLPGDSVHSPELAAHAGKVVGDRGMLWTRRLDVPIDDVWAAISTKEGLDRWWLTRDVAIDLRPGGRFEHHWINTIDDFEPDAFIDFIGVPDDPKQSGNLMRFELDTDGSGTVFSLFDGFQAHLHPLSLPWTASGWHGTVDALETALTGRQIDNDFGLGGEFYWEHLRRHHAFADKAARLASQIDEADWRSAYLDSRLVPEPPESQHSKRRLR